MELISYMIVFWFACYGAANGIAYSRLLYPLRIWISYSSYELDEYENVKSGQLRTGRIAKFFTKLVHCPLCLGFWLGILFSIFGLSIAAQYVYSDLGISQKVCFTLMDGFFGSAAAWITHLKMNNGFES